MQRRLAAPGGEIICRDEVEVLDIESAADPFEHTVMLIMIGIADGFDELCIARASANILQMTVSPAHCRLQRAMQLEQRHIGGASIRRQIAGRISRSVTLSL